VEIELIVLLTSKRTKKMVNKLMYVFMMIVTCR